MPDWRTQDVPIQTPQTKLETLGNMLRDIQVQPDARGMGVTGRAGPVEWRAQKALGQPFNAEVTAPVGPVGLRVQKTLGQPFNAEVTVPVGRGTVSVGRGESGRFISLTQSLRWGK